MDRPANIADYGVACMRLKTNCHDNHNVTQTLISRNFARSYSTFRANPTLTGVLILIILIIGKKVEVSPRFLTYLRETRFSFSY